MTENKTLRNNIKKYAIMFCLAGVVALAPVSSANARYHHRGDTLVAAAVGGAVAGLVGAVVQNTLSSSRTVVVEQPIYIEEEPLVVHETVVVRKPYYYIPTHHVRHIRYHHRHR